MATLIGTMDGVGSQLAAAHKPTTQVTWTTDVEPILQRRCVGCHAKDGFGPMPLTTYDDARRAAGAIREAVLERRMPPWPAARGFGDFSNDRSLTPVEIELLTSWVDGGAPVGPPVAAVPARAAEPPHRSPDLVLAIPVDSAVTATSERFELATDLAGDRWIGGWEFIPGNRPLVEQAVATIVPSTPLGSWTPPESAVRYPKGVAQRLPAGSRVRLEIRYRKTVAPQADRSSIAMYFVPRPRWELRHRLLQCGANAIARDVDALAVTPRVAAAGESIEIVARRPDRTVEPLAVVPRYEPAYPVAYQLRVPVRLPRGTSVNVRSSAAECEAQLDFVSAHRRSRTAMVNGAVSTSPAR